MALTRERKEERACFCACVCCGFAFFEFSVFQVIVPGAQRSFVSFSPDSSALLTLNKVLFHTVPCSEVCGLAKKKSHTRNLSSRSLSGQCGKFFMNLPAKRSLQARNMLRMCLVFLVRPLRTVPEMISPIKSCCEKREAFFCGLSLGQLLRRLSLSKQPVHRPHHPTNLPPQSSKGSGVACVPYRHTLTRVVPFFGIMWVGLHLSLCRNCFQKVIFVDSLTRTHTHTHTQKLRRTSPQFFSRDLPLLDVRKKNG